MIHEHACVANIQQRLRGGEILGANIHVQLVQLSHFAFVAFVLQMNRGGANQSNNGLRHAINRTHKLNALSNNASRVNAANGFAIHKTIWVDEVHHQTNFIRVAAQRQSDHVFATFGGLNACKTISVGVVPTSIGEWPDIGKPNLLAGPFVTRRAWGI